MPSGHASHKGTSNKPNTNAGGISDTAADQSVDPQELLGEGADALRATEAQENAEAIQRPAEQK